MSELARIPLVGQTDAGSAEVQPARDSQLKATNGRWDGSYTPAIPFYKLQRQFRALLCLKKPSCRRQDSLLTEKWICPIHAEPVQIQVLLYIIIFYKALLYSDMLLHVIYVAMQIYGWYHWLYGGKGKTELKVSVLPVTIFIIWIGAGILGTFAWGYLMVSYTNAAVPYADAFTTVMSLIAQWLMARKRLESWFFWIAVDVVAIGVYLYKSLYLTMGLYAVFLILATVGYFRWKATMTVKQTDTGLTEMVEA